MLEYTDAGDGPALLLLHAFPLGLFMWDPQVEALAAKHRVVRFDARGFGGSAPGAGPLTMDRIADDAAALLDHLGIARATVMGCSMGGYAAFAFVRRHADRLERLVLQDTRAAADSDEQKKNRGLLAARVLGEGAPAAVEAFLPKLLGATTQREQELVVAWLRERILAASPQAIADATKSFSTRSRRSRSLMPHAVPKRRLVTTKSSVASASRPCSASHLDRAYGVSGSAGERSVAISSLLTP